MKPPSIALFLALVPLGITVATVDGDARSTQKPDQKERELFFFRNRDLTSCVRKEVQDFNEMFDAGAYRDKVFAEAGLTVEKLRKVHRKNKDTFQTTSEYKALMGAIEARQAELEEVAQIVYACQQEVNEGGASAVGAGAMVGALLAKAMEGGPLDRALTANGEQLVPSSSPTAAPTPAPSPSPTADVPVFPIFVGTHIEAEYLIQAASSYFLGNTTTECLGLSTGIIGVEASLIVTVALGIPSAIQHQVSTMWGFDVGLGPHVGLMAGGFTDGDVVGDTGNCNGPSLFEITIGAGLNLPSLDNTCCNWFYDSNN